MWGSYGPLIFSDLTKKWGDDQPGDCVYSFNPDLSALGQICTQDYPYCIGGDCKKLTASPWLNRGIDPDEFATFMSWVPLLFGSISAVLGGIVSDRVAKSGGPLARVLVAMISNAVAAPICAVTLFVSSPLCFLSKGLGYIVGEMWIGVVLALVVELVPPDLRVTSVALYMFVITNIGGNANVLVPPLKRLIERSSTPHTFHIEAATNVINETSSVVPVITFTEVAVGSYPLRMAVFWLYPFAFFLGALLFGASYFFLKRDLERAKATAPAVSETIIKDGKTFSRLSNESSDVEA